MTEFDYDVEYEPSWEEVNEAWMQDPIRSFSEAGLSASFLPPPPSTQPLEYAPRLIQRAIDNNLPIEDRLHVIIVISNPCLYKIRYRRTLEFIERMHRDEHDLVLYVVELAYEHQKYVVTSVDNPRHLQLRSTHPLWHKENMINLGVEKLLPHNWKAFAWIDADVEFENPSWARDTLRVLNGCRDVVQLFSHCVDMAMDKSAMRVFNSFGYQFEKGRPYRGEGSDFWHPGYAWAMTRRAYERVGGLYESAILGSGDHMMAFSFLGRSVKSVHAGSSAKFKASIKQFEDQAKYLRLGYIPGVILHHYHGSKKNRQYRERWQILLKHAFDPEAHVTRDAAGVLVPTPACPPGLLEDIVQYFWERNEDEDVV